jgi:hypothetical protein
MKLNVLPIEELEVLLPPSSYDFETNCFKNFKEKEAMMNSSYYVREVIEEMKKYILTRKRNLYFDVKVHDLKENEQTANGLWHLDSSLNHGPYYENYLFVTGKHNLTEYVDNVIEIEKQETSKAFSEEVSKHKLKIKRLNSCTITRFYGDRVHRGPKCEIPERRLLVRMINTDMMLPKYDWSKK